MRYRKKPVVVEAEQLTVETADEVASWCGGQVHREPKPSDPADDALILDIPTLEGVMTARLGDWIIRGVHGEFYPIKAAIFEQTYEPVENQ